MTRRGDDEVVVALDARSGSLLWEYTYAAPTEALDEMHVDMSYGDSPQATPLVAAGRVYGLGFTGVLTCLDAVTGKRLWAHDLGPDHGVRIPYFGHAASPIRVGDTVVVIAGGALAFDLENGELRWQNRDFAGSYASPILFEGPAGTQLVAAVYGEVVGLDPKDGRLLWRHEHANEHRTFLATPVAGSDDVVFASAYFLGSIALRLAPDGSVRELWEQPELQVAYSNAVRIGDTVFASHNRNLTAIDLPSGEILWRERGLGRSNLIRAGERILLLDDKGKLTVDPWSRWWWTSLRRT